VVRRATATQPNINSFYFSISPDTGFPDIVGYIESSGIERYLINGTTNFVNVLGGVPDIAMSLFENGNKIGEDTVLGTITIDANSDLFIGGAPNGSGGSAGNFVGDIAEVIVYSNDADNANNT